MSFLHSLACAIDPVLWAKTQIMFEPEEWQCNVLRSTAPRVALNCSRQAGKSTISAALALHTALHRRDSLVLIAAPSLRQSGELSRKVEDFLSQLAVRPQVAESNASTTAFANGSRIVVIPTSEATLRGFSNPRLVIVDEASRVSDEAIAAIRPMLSNGGGKLVLLSSPAGKRGAFFQAYTEQRGDWEWHEIKATQIARISPEFLEAEKRAMGPRVFGQEYMCEFNETDGALFDLDQINATMSSEVRPLFGENGTFAARQSELLSNRVIPLFGGRQ